MAFQKIAGVTAKRIRNWYNKFATYRGSITQKMIEDWILQFEQVDHILAGKALDNVIYFSYSTIAKGFKEVLSTIDGWHVDTKKRRGNWYFAPFSGSAGKSGDSMIYQFRHAIGLAQRSSDDLFVYRSDLVRKNPSSEDTVVLVDDFSGSGEQACDAWKKFFSELLPQKPRIILLLVAATQKAIERIENETEMLPMCFRILTDKHNVFAQAHAAFSLSEKTRLLTYCEKADKRQPKGYSNCGLLVVFDHTCPNDSLPILHATNKRWHGLFVRNEYW